MTFLIVFVKKKKKKDEEKTFWLPEFRLQATIGQ